MSPRARRLAAALREVARQFDTDNFCLWNCGICNAVGCVEFEETQDWARSYADVQWALRKMGYKLFMAPYVNSAREWEPRANMCLLMAEFLESEEC